MNYWPGARQNVKCDTLELSEVFNTTLRNVFKETKYAVQDLPEININILDSAFNGKFKDRGKKEYKSVTSKKYESIGMLSFQVI